jgi:hypothetical protein
MDSPSPEPVTLLLECPRCHARVVVKQRGWFTGPHPRGAVEVPPHTFSDSATSFGDGWTCVGTGHVVDPIAWMDETEPEGTHG